MSNNNPLQGLSTEGLSPEVRSAVATIREVLRANTLALNAHAEAQNFAALVAHLYLIKA